MDPGVWISITDLWISITDLWISIKGKFRFKLLNYHAGGRDVKGNPFPGDFQMKN